MAMVHAHGGRRQKGHYLVSGRALVMALLEDDAQVSAKASSVWVLVGTEMLNAGPDNGVNDVHGR